MTDRVARLDLEPIKERLENYYDGSELWADSHELKDVTALLAEVERLRSALLQLEQDNARQIIGDLLEEYREDDTRTACDACPQCGPMLMCEFHTILSILAGRTATPQLHILRSLLLCEAQGRRHEEKHEDKDVGNNIVDACSGIGQNRPSGNGVPGRFLSLGDIVEEFDTAALSLVLFELHSVEGGALISRITGSGGKPPGESVHTRCAGALDYAEVLFTRFKIGDCDEHVATAKYLFGQEGLDNSTVWTLVKDLQTHITAALNKTTFIKIAPDRRPLVNSDRLFGDAVFDAFESARSDITESGNCLAAECCTASVFHLMRVAEIGLRALAYDRDVHVFKNARTMLELPLELATWDQLIRELEDAEKAIQGFPQTLMREEQFDFYHGALMQYRAFKNVFRNNIMHTRDSYDRDEAISIYNKVQEFMRVLAGKIREGTRTPTIWV